MATVRNGYIVHYKSKSGYYWKRFFPFDDIQLSIWIKKEFEYGNKDLFSIQPATATTVKKKDVPGDDKCKDIWITRVKATGADIVTYTAYNSGGIVYRVEHKERPLSDMENSINNELENMRDHRKNADKLMCLTQIFYGSMRKHIGQELLFASHGTGGYDEYNKHSYFAMTNSYSCLSYEQYKKATETMVAQLDLAHSLASQVLGYALTNKSFSGTFGEYVLSHRCAKTHVDVATLTPLLGGKISIQQAFQEIEKYNEGNDPHITLLPVKTKTVEKADEISKELFAGDDLLLIRSNSSALCSELSGTKHFIKALEIRGWETSYLILFGGKNIKHLEIMFGGNQAGLIELLKSQKEV